MEGNKKILSQILVLLSFLSLLCSCVDKVEYKYKDVVITRYDRLGHSEYFCNKSDKKCKIKVSGSQNYYTALLCIDRETKKVWIVHWDCYIQQQEVDSTHFQGEDMMYRILKDELNINYNTLHPNRTPSVFEEKFECYALLGLGDYLKYEKRYSEKEFPHSKIEAQYY